jgi:YidC/Oxa1 family membrane protein insertase
MQEEFQKIGYNPAESLLGCLPLLIQFPILIGLYRAIIVALGSTPQALFELTERVYGFIDLTALLPVDNQFYWLNLAQPDPLFILPVLVFATTFLQQKLLVPQTKKDDSNKKDKEDESPMAGMTQSMQYTMPVMFGFFALQFPAGLSLYFVLSNLIGMGQGIIIRRSADEPDETKTAAKGKQAGEGAKSSASGSETSGGDKKDGQRAKKGGKSRAKRKRR